MRFLRLAPVLMAVALGGCGLFNNSTGPLIVDAKSPISDVPVPAGFTMGDESSSKVISGSSLRLVDHRYKGGDDLLPVVTFYKEQMPGKEWVFVDQNQPNGREITLHYTKRNEDCHVTVTKRLLDTVIRIKIDPLAK